MVSSSRLPVQSGCRSLALRLKIDEAPVGACCGREPTGALGATLLRILHDHRCGSWIAASKKLVLGSNPPRADAKMLDWCPGAFYRSFIYRRNGPGHPL
jgi:hypothetical protein